MMLNSTKLFVSTALGFAIAWIACVVAVMAMPSAMLVLAGDMVHLDMSAFTWSVTATGALVGLIAWSLAAGVIAWLVAMIYNRLPFGAQ